MSERISFEEAITDKALLKNRFDELSVPQQVALKLLYGVPLSEHRRDPKTGFSEIDLWAILHGACEMDDLGYPTKPLPAQAPPYAPKEYREAALILGRRSGKTDTFASTVVAFEATCGGHERYLRNRFTIACVPATLKSVRGFASPVSVFDEVGVWYQEAESANPDYEIYRAVSPGQAQFPDRRVVLISSPWNKAGLLYQYFDAGTEGHKERSAVARAQYAEALVLNAPTAAVQNPVVSRESLARERARDQLAFEREFLARFQDSISGFIPSGLVESARDEGVLERAYVPGVTYLPAIDPAFRRDAFAFTIVHNDHGTIVQDVVRRFQAAQGQALNPDALLDVVAPLIHAYGSTLVYSDQYHLESFGQLLRMRGIEIVPVTFTAKSKAQIYGNLQQLFLQRKIRLLDDYETLRELKSLERTLTEGGQVQIGAPRGLHDDMAAVVAIAASQAMWASMTTEGSPAATRKADWQIAIDEQIRRKWQGLEGLGAWD